MATLLLAASNGSSAPAGTIFKRYPRNAKRTVKVPLDCLAKRGLDIAGVDVPFGIRADAPFAAAFTDIKLMAGAAADADALKCSEVMP